MADMERTSHLLHFGRHSIDLVVDSNKHPIIPVNKGVKVRIGQKYRLIPTDRTPSKEQDKVTATISLDEFVNDLAHTVQGGGGGYNSLRVGEKFRMTNPDMEIMNYTMCDHHLTLPNNYTVDLARELQQHNIDSRYLDYIPLQYCFVWGGENKLIVRNPLEEDTDFYLTARDKRDLLRFIERADCILINVLNDPDMTSVITRTVDYENDRYYDAHKVHKNSDIKKLVNDPSHTSRAKHRKILTAVSYSPVKMPWETIRDEVIQFSSTIFNQEDFLKLFYGEDTERSTRGSEKARMDMTLHAIWQMRNGIPVPHGAPRKIKDEYNNVYITLGKKGCLINIGDTVGHYTLYDQVIDDMNKDIRRLGASTKGAGDAFTEGVAVTFLRRRMMNPIETTAVANTGVCLHFGLPRSIYDSEVRTVKIYDLKKYKAPNRLYKG